MQYFREVWNEVGEGMRVTGVARLEAEMAEDVQSEVNCVGEA